MADPDSAPAAGVTCPACGFVNAPHSLYCQDCGVKMPVAPPSYLSQTPSSVGEAPSTSPPTTPKPKARILSVNRGPSPVWRFLGVTLRTLVYAAVAALIIQLLRPPENLPPAAPPLEADVIAQVRDLLSSTASRGQPVDAPWPHVNAYLAGALVAEPGQTSSFVRAAVSPTADGFILLVQKNLGRVPVYTQISYRVLARGNGLAVEPTGAAIGRVRLPAWAAAVVERMNGSLATALAYELEILRNARSVKITAGSARFDFSPPPP